MEGRARIAATAGMLGGIGMIAGSFGEWAQSGSITLTGLGGISEPALYPELEQVFAPGWLTLLLGIAALGALVAIGAVGPTAGGIALGASGAGGAATAALSIIDIAGVGGFGADPAWGVVAVAVGGLLSAVGGLLLVLSAEDVWAYPASGRDVR